MKELQLKRLVELVKDLGEARFSHEKIEIMDSDLYSRIDRLTGYVAALNDEKGDK